MHLPLGMQTYIMGHSQQQTQQLTSDMAAESKKPDPRCGQTMMKPLEFVGFNPTVEAVLPTAAMIISTTMAKFTCCQLFDEEIKKIIPS